MDLVGAIKEVLKAANKPLHVNMIYQEIINGGLWKSSGKTPKATISARLYSDIKQKADNSLFVKVAPQTFTLRDNDVAENFAKTKEQRPAEKHCNRCGFLIYDLCSEST